MSWFKETSLKYLYVYLLLQFVLSCKPRSLSVLIIHYEDPGKRIESFEQMWCFCNPKPIYRHEVFTNIEFITFTLC